MATLTKGHTFADGQQITAARLNNLVDNATISGIAQADFSAGYSVVTIADNSPSSPSEGTLWFDTSFAAEEGILRYYTGTHWVPVGRGFLGYNTSGSTIEAGALVADNSQAAGTGNMRQEIKACTRHLVPLGAALGQITNGSLGVVLTEGRILTLLKATGTAVTAGDRVVCSSTAGQATTATDANYGSFFGSGVAGIWTKDQGSGATSGEAMLFRPALASGISFRTPTKLLDAVTPGANATWSGSFGTPQFVTWSTTPPGVIARLVQFRVTDGSAAADTTMVFGIRQRGSSLTVLTGAPAMAGGYTTDAGTPADEKALSGQLWVPTDPAGDGTDRAEYFVDIETAGNIANVRVTVMEVAVVCGGRTLL
jgi:hypothetical protein